MSAPELKRGGCKCNDSITATASDLRFSLIERGDWGMSFSPIMYQNKILLKLIIFEKRAKECVNMTCHLDEILILTFGLNGET
jgi:hypothetical protein